MSLLWFEKEIYCMEIDVQLTRLQYTKMLTAMLFRRSSLLFILVLFFAILALTFSMGIGIYLAFLYLGAVMAAYAFSILNATFRQKNRNYFIPKKYTFSNKGVLTVSANGEHHLKWDAFIDWKRIGDFYIIYVTKHTFIVIPQSAISAGEIPDFQRLLLKQIRPPKKQK